MITSILSIYRLILLDFRRRFHALVALSVVVGVLEMLGVASIMPLIAALIDPSGAPQGRAGAWLGTMLGYGGALPPVHVVGFVTIGLFVVANVAALTLSWLSVRYSADLSVALSRQLALAHFHQPFAYFIANPPATLATQLCNEVAQFASNGILQLCTSLVRVVQIILTALLLVWIAPAFTTTALLVLGVLYAVVYRLSTSQISAAGAVSAVAAGQAQHLATEMYGNARDILLRGGSRVFVDRVCAALAALYRADAVGRLLPSLPKYVLEIIAVTLIFSLPIYRSLIGGDARAEMPLIATFACAGFRLLPTMQQLYASLSILNFYLPSAQRLQAILETRVAAEAAGHQRRLPAMVDRIEFVDVAHTYAESRRPAIARASFVLRRGKRTAVVGPSGAGKSTLIDLLLGFLVPSAGRILIDGQPLADRLAWAADAVGYVPQTPLILTDSLAANIAFGRAATEIDREQCFVAATKAGIGHLIAGQPKGLDAVVGRDLNGVSGGERQRLAIARALYARPSLLVLDEPASALDPPTAAGLFNMLTAQDLGATVVVITHDLDHLAGFDNVVYVDRGEVVMAAPLDRLLRNCSGFARFRGAEASSADASGGEVTTG